MRILVALGGNALLRRGESPSVANQIVNVRRAADALVKLVDAGHELVVSHGNGPQIGLLALQAANTDAESAYPMDVLGAETDGMIGYLIEQALENVLQGKQRVATLLTQVEVDPTDNAFKAPTKPIGPVYSQEEAQRIAQQRGWTMAEDGKAWRRVVPSPRPIAIPDTSIIQLLLDNNVVVICAGGGGIPVVRQVDDRLVGVEAVIDKDRTSGLLALTLDADMLLMLTDVAAVQLRWGQADAEDLKEVNVTEINSADFAAGSMGPKIEAACQFVSLTSGIAAIGALGDALDIVEGRAGTRILPEKVKTNGNPN